jgi:hypothetical protein
MLNFPTLVIFVIIRGGAISKNMIKKMIATAVAFALVAVCANAQEVKVDNNKFAVPTDYVELGNYKFYTASMEQVVEWFNKSSQDSLFVLNETKETSSSIQYFVTKYYWREGKKKQMVYDKPFVFNKPSENVVFNQANQPVVVEESVGADGKTVARRVKVNYYHTTTDKMTQQQKAQVLSGEARAFDPEHKNYRGWDRHKAGISLLGGANYVENKFNPLATLRFSYETCHLSYELEGTFSRASHTEESAAYGSKYSTYIGSANVVWKAIQNRLKTSYVGLGANAGYALHKTDADSNQEFYSENHGFTFGGFARFLTSFNKHFAVMVEGGWKMYPKVKHSGNGQEWDCNGVYLMAGLRVAIPTK